MFLLVTASVFFILIHFLIAGTRVRDRLVASLGEAKFRICFTLLAALGLAGMVVGYIQAESSPVWDDGVISLPTGVFYIGNLLAVLLLVIGTLTPSPNSIVTEKAYQQGKVEIVGMLRITRHPGMLGIGLWALMHLLANGDSASIVFFGALAMLALLGPLSMDRKKLRLDGERYAQVMAQTSYLPFRALLRNRNLRSQKLPDENRSVWAEIGWLKPGLAVLVFVGLVFAHPWLAGVPVW